MAVTPLRMETYIRNYHAAWAEFVKPLSEAVTRLLPWSYS
jgi:hypothetical protein